MVNRISKQKLRGGYYTPPEIVEFLVGWAIQAKNSKVLEPCFGDGNFIIAICKRMLELEARKSDLLQQLYGSELNRGECDKARLRIFELFQEEMEFPHLKSGDFFLHYEQSLKDIKFDAIVGNPPFIRYQHFEEEHRTRGFRIMERVGLHPTRLTNAWVPFLLASSLLLKKNARLGMVIPAELMQVKYTSELRLFLSEFLKVITLITFDRIIFPGIQQEVLLLLAENTDNGDGINVIQLKDEKRLRDYIYKLPTAKDSKPVDHSQDKWVQYYLTRQEILLLRKLKNDKRLTTLGDFAEVDVGVVTGRNDFFVVDADQIKEFQLNGYTMPLVGRTSQIEGLVFTNADWTSNNANKLKTNLLNLPAHSETGLPCEVRKYIKLGEELEYDKGYKCRIRSPWYYVPSVWVPDAFLFRQIYNRPKLVLNEAGAVPTDTIHRVRFKQKSNGRKVAACFHNSLTFSFAEVMGRSYGGGVLEIEPNEAEELPIPYFDISSQLITELDLLARQKRDIEQVVNVMDDLLLRKRLGLSSKEIRMLNKIWEKLAIRRKNRK